LDLHVGNLAFHISGVARIGAQKQGAKNGSKQEATTENQNGLVFFAMPPWGCRHDRGGWTGM